MIWLILRIKTFSLILQYLVTVRKCGRQNLEVSCSPSVISLIEDECMTPLSVSGYFSFKLLKFFSESFSLLLYWCYVLLCFVDGLGMLSFCT